MGLAQKKVLSPEEVMGVDAKLGRRGETLQLSDVRVSEEEKDLREVYARLDYDQQEILSVLVDVWPRALTRVDLASEAGRTLRDLERILPGLRRAEAILYPEPGHVKASSLLFGKGR